MFLCSMCVRTILRTTFSNSLMVVGRILIGLKFWGNFGFLPDCGKIIAFAFLEEDGKHESHKQWLIRCVRWTSVFRGRCPRHSFVMPSIPPAFLSLRELLVYVRDKVLLSQEDCCPQPRTRPEHGPPLVIYDFSHASHMVGIGFPDSLQPRWLFLRGGTWGPKDYE
jgi:hypothetical protein